MPHGRKTPKLSRTASHRDAMLANMAASLFLHSKVKTTTPRAKALRPFVDRLISIAKQGSLHSKRQVASVVTDKEALKKLFQEIVPKFQERNSGYSRVVKAGFRRGDAAEVSVVELLIEKPKAEKEAAEKKEGRLKKLSSKLKRGGKAEAAPAAPAAKKSGGKAKAAKATAPVEEPETEPEETTIEDSDAGEEKDKS